MTEPYGPQTRAIERFLDHLRPLSLDDFGHVVAVWRDLVGPAWHDAEDTVSHGIESSGRQRERDAVLERVYDIFREAPWYNAEQPGGRVPGSDATAQYVTTVALFALLVCDQVELRAVETLYAPFAERIPLPVLGAGVGGDA